MAIKKLGDKMYKILETEDAHTVASKDTRGATRGLEFKDGTNKLVGPVELVEVETTTPNRDVSMGGKLVIDVAEIILPIVTEYLTEKAISSFDYWLQNRRTQNKKMQSEEKESLAARNIKIKRKLESRKFKTTDMVSRESSMFSYEFDFVYEEYQINMTSEEVQKELIDIFMLEVIRAKKIWKVSHANIVDVQDFNGVALKGKAIIEQLSNPGVLSNINALLASKPELLEEWETIALSDILGRELLKDGQFIPIESESFKNALTVSM